MSSTSTDRRTAKRALALLGAAALTLVAGSSALAATQSNTTSNSGATITVNPVSGVVSDGPGSPATYLEGIADGTVLVDGSGFVTTPGSVIAPDGVGIYLVYGPKRSDYYTNGDPYYDAVWLNSDGVYGSPDFDGEVFADVEIDIAETYETAGGETIDCSDEPCYIQTFTANGRDADDTDPRANDVAIEVKW
ncbi:MAG: hypothetical protein LBD51_08480 [Bifidobacteriaceae bacterium]|jgi:hypothetical protein|nr:hypothetical protein [Bifidobacteriaceae bacterium]